MIEILQITVKLFYRTFGMIMNPGITALNKLKIIKLLNLRKNKRAIIIKFVGY